MIQGILNFIQSCFYCVICCDKKEPALSDQAYGELETQPYVKEFTQITD